MPKFCDDVDSVIYGHDTTKHEPNDAHHSSNEDNDSDDELTPAELLECITHETDMFSVDYYDDACAVLLAQPGFLVLSQTAWTSLVLFPDGTHAIFITFRSLLVPTCERLLYRTALRH
jgi:hypothetical protein